MSVLFLLRNKQSKILMKRKRKSVLRTSLLALLGFGYYGWEFGRNFVLTGTAEILIKIRRLHCKFNRHFDSTFVPPSKYEPKWRTLFSWKSFYVKLWKTKHINPLFSKRDNKGEFEILFEKFLVLLRNISVMIIFFLISHQPW